MTRSSQSSREGELPRVGEVLEGKYVLRERLASGGMGIIIKAEHRKLERDVAVKLLHPRLISDDATVERFRREIDLAKRLAHPNIVQLLDYGRTETGVLFIVMEYLEGEDLDQLVKRDGPLGLERTVEIMLQVLDGLAEAHDRDLIHRDLKPSNVFLTKRRRGGEHAKLLDFGVAKSLSARDSSLTQTGSACGTAMYMPPETLFDHSPSKRIDVYAVGLMTLEALMGTRVFDAETLPQTLMLHVKQPARMPRALIDTPVGDVLERATEKRPAERYADALEMLQALGDAAEEMPDGLEYDPTDTAEVGSAIDKIEFGSPSELPDSPSDAVGEPRPNESTERIPATAPHETPSPEAHPGGADSNPDSAGPRDDESFDDAKTEVMRTPPPDLQDVDEATSEADEAAESETSVWQSTWIWGAAAGSAVVLLVFSFLILVLGERADSNTEGTEPGSETVAKAAPSKSAPAEAKPETSEDDSESPEPSSPPTEPGPSPTIEVRVDSNPSDAIVFRGDERLGETPGTFELERPSEGSIALKFHRPGYHNAKLTIDPSAGQREYSADLRARSTTRPEEPEPTEPEPDDSSPTPTNQSRTETASTEDSSPSSSESNPSGSGGSSSSETGSRSSGGTSADQGSSSDPGSSSEGGSGESGGSNNAFEQIADDYEME